MQVIVPLVMTKGNNMILTLTNGQKTIIDDEDYKLFEGKNLMNRWNQRRSGIGL